MLSTDSDKAAKKGSRTLRSTILFQCFSITICLSSPRIKRESIIDFYKNARKHVCFLFQRTQSHLYPLILRTLLSPFGHSSS